MLIVLGLYFGVIWVVFSMLGLLPWNRYWKSVVHGGAAIIALVVIGALNHTTPTGPVSVQGVATKIAPNVSGTVVDVSVRPSEWVAKGDPLFRIDDTPFRIEVARLTVSLESARSAADQLLSDLTAPEARIESLIALLTFGIWSKQSCAPEDGFVNAVSLRPGNRVSIPQGAIVFVVPDDRHLIASLPQSSCINLSLGDQIRLALRILPGGEIPGAVIPLPVGTAEGVVDSGTGLPSLRVLAGGSSYPVLIEVPDQVNIEDFPFGASGTTLVIANKAGAIGVLAEILFWFTNKLNYI